MNLDLEAVIEDGRRRMRQFEERTASQIDTFDSEVDNTHYQLGHKFSSITTDLRPVSAPLWGVILETADGQRIYKQDAPFDVVLKCPRKCPPITGRSSYQYLQQPHQDKQQQQQQQQARAEAQQHVTSYYNPTYAHSDLPVSLADSTIPRLSTSVSDNYKLPYDDYWNMHKEIEPFQPSAAARTIMEGRKWRVDKYLFDESYVSNPPYGIVMNKRHFEPQIVDRPARKPRFFAR